MAGRKGKPKPPSRRKYEQENPTISFRLTKEDKGRLMRHLAASGQSPAGFIKSILDQEEALVEERINACVKKQFGRLGDRLHWHNELLWQLLSTCRKEGLPAICPLCEYKGNHRLLLAWGDEIGTDGKRQEAPTWKCPNCGWFVDIFRRMDPESVRWDDPEEAKLAPKPKSPPGKTRRGTRRYSGK